MSYPLRPRHVRPLRPPNEAAIERYWRIDRRSWPGFIQPTSNVAPTTQVPILVQAHDGAIELIGTRWGLIPAWWKDDRAPTLTFNACSEEAARKPTWRQNMRSMRCLMPARGWYEWDEKEEVRSESGCTVRRRISFPILCRR